MTDHLNELRMQLDHAAINLTRAARHCEALDGTVALLGGPLESLEDLAAMLADCRIDVTGADDYREPPLVPLIQCDCDAPIAAEHRDTSSSLHRASCPLYDPAGLDTPPLVLPMTPSGQDRGVLDDPFGVCHIWAVTDLELPRGFRFGALDADHGITGGVPAL